MNLVELLLIRLKNRVKIQFVKTSKIFKLLEKRCFEGMSIIFVSHMKEIQKNFSDRFFYFENNILREEKENVELF
ncbi:hypothetical protein OSSY52_08690 [Tepiditoga spiralis]|uniref:ABC transporter ATP-binding protein n=1 Tax=Tepiditoga spiralis TaxID=2108365 RepID=A0A7G1G2Y3_9BACT|nr:hypothetical protein [Tepiditoga spiralis]BBE30728.1 hypothetical protein OSSY52_08690 [Tepiditoga spiralis]